MDEARNHEGSSDEAKQPNPRDAQGFKETGDPGNEDAASVRGGRGLRRMDPGRRFERGERPRRSPTQALHDVDALSIRAASEAALIVSSSEFERSKRLDGANSLR
jgi:hypothetical protein